MNRINNLKKKIYRANSLSRIIANLLINKLEFLNLYMWTYDMKTYYEEKVWKMLIKKYTCKCSLCKYIITKENLNPLNVCNTCKFQIKNEIDENYYNNYEKK